MKSPYRTTIDSEYLNAPHVEIRWKKTLSFIDKFHADSGLDIGDRTPFTDQLEAHYSCPFANTTIDLDEGDVLYIPIKLYHGVTTLSPRISISYHFTDKPSNRIGRWYDWIGEINGTTI